MPCHLCGQHHKEQGVSGTLPSLRPGQTYNISLLAPGISYGNLIATLASVGMQNLQLSTASGRGYSGTFTWGGAAGPPPRVQGITYQLITLRSSGMEAYRRA